MHARHALIVSAILGFLAVALGAFGAHGLKSGLVASGHWDAWNTATHYHLVHAVAMLAIALHAPLRVWSWRLWLIGILLFSGSLYALSTLHLRMLGPVTPIGGVFLLAGWLALIFEKPKATIPAEDGL